MNEQITSAAELDALTDLVVRLNRANKGLLSQSRTNITSERTRLEGKAEGVRLALSYVEEAIRARPDQPQRVQPSREDVARGIRVAGDTNNNSPRLIAESERQADAVLALFAEQPTVAEIKAEALRDGARHYAGRMRAMDPNWRRVTDCLNTLAADIEEAADRLAPQPHETDRIEREARS